MMYCWPPTVDLAHAMDSLHEASAAVGLDESERCRWNVLRTLDVYGRRVPSVFHDTTEKHWYIRDFTFLEDGVVL